MIPADLESRLSALNIVLDPHDVSRLDAFLTMLLRRNEDFNLTSIRDESLAWERHILDSLTLLGPLTSADARTVADVGSGGGLPGIPLAICMPQANFTLIETTGKKANFLREVIEQLKITNARVVQERAETLGQDHHEFREMFDAVIARAVGPMRVLLELTVPLARIGGVVLAVKGERAEAELAESKPALHKLHSTHVQTILTPTGRIVVIEKQRKTPRIYPRMAGEPKRKPL